MSCLLRPVVASSAFNPPPRCASLFLIQLPFGLDLLLPLAFSFDATSSPLVCMTLYGFQMHPPGCPRLLLLQFCHECLNQLPSFAPLPCPRCKMASFCCYKCRAAAELRHCRGNECGLPWAHVLPEEAVLACRLAAMVRLLYSTRQGRCTRPLPDGAVLPAVAASALSPTASPIFRHAGHPRLATWRRRSYRSTPAATPSAFRPLSGLLAYCCR